jgi:hypothetical protein
VDDGAGAAAEAPPPKTRAEAAAELKAELLAWRAAFEAREGRAPGRDDIAEDTVARELFADFSRVRGWAEEGQ